MRRNYELITKTASIYSIGPYEAALYLSFVDELEKQGHLQEFEKDAFLGNLIAKGSAQLATKMPKTYAAVTGAANKVNQAAINNPLFNHAMMTGDVTSMGMTAGAGALKGVANLYSKAPKKGVISLKKVSKGLDTAAPVVTAGQAAGLNTASKALDAGGDLIDSVAMMF